VNGINLIGAVLGGAYLVIEKIADGGMGSVYKGIDVKLERPVALKVIRRDLAESPEFAERFAREAKALASVLHPALAIIFSYGDDHGLYFMALELVDGRPLHEVIFDAGCVLPFRRAADIAAQVLDGLAAIHERGIVHRDLKPPNIMIVTRGSRDHVKLVDFGLVKLKSATALTDPDVLIGTPAYMSPEQARGDVIDSRADLYALSIVLYEMLVGAPPFEGVRVHELLERQARAVPVAPGRRRRGMPPELEAVVLKGLAKSPAERFQTAEEYATVLRDLELPVDPPVRVEAAPPPEGEAARGPERTPVAGAGGVDFVD
jgi:eukaryotic-like serine/threonine-protein kinase